MKQTIRFFSLAALLWSAYILLFYLLLVIQNQLELPYFSIPGDTSSWLRECLLAPALYLGILAVPLLLLLSGILAAFYHVKYPGQRIYRGHRLLCIFVFCTAVLGGLYYVDVWICELLS